MTRRLASVWQMEPSFLGGVIEQAVCWWFCHPLIKGCQIEINAKMAFEASNYMQSKSAFCVSFTKTKPSKDQSLRKRPELLNGQIKDICWTIPRIEDKSLVIHPGKCLAHVWSQQNLTDAITLMTFHSFQRPWIQASVVSWWRRIYFHLQMWCRVGKIWKKSGRLFYCRDPVPCKLYFHLYALTSTIWTLWIVSRVEVSGGSEAIASKSRNGLSTEICGSISKRGTFLEGSGFVGVSKKNDSSINRSAG